MFATPKNPNEPQWLEQIAHLKPDFIFSFYYRHMLSPELLACARKGAYNMHGSLLPKYRGRVPVNWAVIHGERQTGATLHEMVTKPDAGAIAGQQAVPILPDDTAFEVFQKVTVAAEMVLDNTLPSILNDTLKMQAQDLSQGSYFGGRKPEDGRIQWTQSAVQIHNLIRAVAPPYPGAFTELQGQRLRILRSRVLHEHRNTEGTSCLYWQGSTLRAVLKDGSMLELLEIEHQGQLLDQQGWNALFGSMPVTV